VPQYSEKEHLGEIITFMENDLSHVSVLKAAGLEYTGNDLIDSDGVIFPGCDQVYIIVRVSCPSTSMT
jgi:hypothetical protein